MVNTIGVKIKDSIASEGIRILRELQDDLPDTGSWASVWNGNRQWLNDHCEQVSRLIELKGLEKTSDFLGIAEQTLRTWQRKQ